jgi:hypothetical protein
LAINPFISNKTWHVSLNEEETGKIKEKTKADGTSFSSF